MLRLIRPARFAAHRSAWLGVALIGLTGNAQVIPAGGSGNGASTGAVANLSVTSFGAVGDGATNDAPAIAKAIEACAARTFPHNGCERYFPSGVYRIAAGLTLPSYVHIRGDGWATSVIQLAPDTSADVLTIPAGTMNFSVTGVTLDGNASHGGRGNCLSILANPNGPNHINTANKQTAPTNGYKDGYFAEDMFSNCSNDGVSILAYSFELWFDNFFVYNNGVYGIYIQGTDSLFSNFVSERNGTAGLYVTNANNKFVNAKIIWNGFADSTEAAVVARAPRNIFLAIEAQDNYVSGFLDESSDNQFIACQADTNGYANGRNNSSSRHASGFVISGTNGVYSGDKVTDYRGHLRDGHFATEWPYTVTNAQQSKIDITFDGTNQPPAVAISVPQVEAPTAGHAACIKSAGPPVILGSCSSAIDATGACTCN